MLMHYVPEVTAVEQVDEDQLKAEQAQAEFTKSNHIPKKEEGAAAAH
jgi:hypothetical protein